MQRRHREDQLLGAVLFEVHGGARVRTRSLDPRHDDELFVAGRAAWQVLAGSALAGAGPRFTAQSARTVDQCPADA